MAGFFFYSSVVVEGNIRLNAKKQNCQLQYKAGFATSTEICDTSVQRETTQRGLKRFESKSTRKREKIKIHDELTKKMGHKLKITNLDKSKSM